MIRRKLAVWSFTATALTLGGCADHQMDRMTADEHAAHDQAHTMQMHEDHSVSDHAAHQRAMSQMSYRLSFVSYDLADKVLLDRSGAERSLLQVIGGERNVALNFIFTTCTTICPVMTATFAQARDELGEAANNVEFVSISIDPEYDRPAVLQGYAEKFGAAVDGWTFLTGDSTDIVSVLTSFDVYAGSKTNHQPVTLLRRAGESGWSRIDGLASGSDIAREISARLLD